MKLTKRQLRKIIQEAVLEEQGEEVISPLGIGVLGAPASGKSYITNLMKAFKNKRVSNAFASGRDLTVDKLRGEIQTKSGKDQLKYFVESYTMFKDLSEKHPDIFGKWFGDIEKLWNNKLKKALEELKNPITVSINSSGYVSLNGASSKDGSHEVIDSMKDDDAQTIIDGLDPYQDYKRVVRYYQLAQQAVAKQTKKDLTFDESGDEPDKIVNRFDQLHDKDGDGIPEKGDYVTNVVLVHPENVASNIIQNANRVITGKDGGRDSSGAIIAAYNDIEAGKQKYSDNAEETFYAKSAKDLQSSSEIQAALSNANIDDDVARGDKPIDVFVQVGTMSPDFAFNLFSKQMSEEQQKAFKAFILYHAEKLELPQDAKATLRNLSGMSNREAFDTLASAAESGQYDHQHGGIKQADVDDYRRVLNSGEQSVDERFNTRSGVIFVERWQKLAGILKD